MPGADHRKRGAENGPRKVSPIAAGLDSIDPLWLEWGRGAMDKARIQRNALADEACRTTLREAESRYCNELLGDEERMLLLDRIKRLRRQLGLVV
jgi:hypothetical protein